MNKENSEKLINDFPKLYKGIEIERQAWANGKIFGPMAFGFECGDGWFKLIYDLSAKIEAIINSLPEEQQKGIYAAQVKEKFGTLRFYMRCETDEISDLINVAENASYTICEGCSEPSIVLGTGWLVNTCKTCYIKYAEERGGDIENAAKFWDYNQKRRDRRAKALVRLERMKGKNINNKEQMA